MDSLCLAQLRGVLQNRFDVEVFVLDLFHTMLALLLDLNLRMWSQTKFHLYYVYVRQVPEEEMYDEASTIM